MRFLFVFVFYVVNDPNASGGGNPFSCVNIAVEELYRPFGGEVTAYNCLNNIAPFESCSCNFFGYQTIGKHQIIQPGHNLLRKKINYSHFYMAWWLYLLVGVVVFEIDGLAIVEGATKSDRLFFLLYQFAKIGDVDLVVHFHVKQQASDVIVPF